jgi:histone H3/H4
MNEDLKEFLGNLKTLKADIKKEPVDRIAKQSLRGRAEEIVTQSRLLHFEIQDSYAINT